MMIGLIIGIVVASAGYVAWGFWKSTRSHASSSIVTAGPEGLDEWVAMLAHELRSPVSGMIGLAEMAIEEDAKLSDLTQTNLQLISHSGARLSHLLNDLLDSQRIRTGNLQSKPVPVHLRSVVSRVLSINSVQTTGKPVKLINDVPADCPNVLADPDQLEQILFNLVGNSIKFTDAGQVRVWCQPQRDHLTITVEDTGKGLSKENLDRILDQTEDRLVPGGMSNVTTGLGLKISSRLLELHGSRLTADSAPGIGSYFSFTLPVTNDMAPVDVRYEGFISKRNQVEPTVQNLTPNRPRSRTGKYEIMLVDDEAINLRVMNAQLERASYAVVECSDGQEALKRLDDGHVPDLILLDVMMPRLNGFETLKRIRERFSGSELPVILLTAKNHSIDILTGFQHGANDYVTKPIAKDELLARIKTHIELSKSTKAFSVFVPLEFLTYLGYKSILDVQLGDQVEKRMTVLFCDIKDFSRISENMSPKEAFDFINTFLGVVSPVIRENNGFIDKYIGDAVMALFPNSPDDALTAAVRMAEALKSLNTRRESQGLDAIRVGIGLHTGDLMLGMIGEEKRMDGTVISDAVNTASRMEGLTKVFDTTVIISSSVLNELTRRDDFHYKYLGKLKVKGKNEMLNVYGVIEGDDESRVEIERLTSGDFEAGLEAFYKRNFTGASVHFNEVLKKNPGNRAATIFLQRAAKLMVTGVPADWDGTDVG